MCFLQIPVQARGNYRDSHSKADFPGCDIQRVPRKFAEMAADVVSGKEYALRATMQALNSTISSKQIE
jgi:hypothetical protein